MIQFNAVIAMKTLTEFWPFYIAQHMKPATRRLHFAGTTIGLACLAAAVITRNAWLLLPGLILSYGLAWIGHFFIEKNRPATFQYPLLSLRADFRMYSLMWQGRMEREIASQREQIQPYLANR